MAGDLIQPGDVFANDYLEYTVINVSSTDEVKVENLAGMIEYKTARELIEIAAEDTGRMPASH